MLSNFVYLSGTLIPNMVSQLESVFGVSKEEDRNVRFSRYHMARKGHDPDRCRLSSR